MALCSEVWATTRVTQQLNLNICFSRMYSTLLQTETKRETVLLSILNLLRCLRIREQQQSTNARNRPSARGTNGVFNVMQRPLESDPNKKLDWP